MHEIHTTHGFIVDARPYAEAGKIMSIFTRDFGLVSAVAQGIRLERSKLRYHAQLYSFGIFSLVRGKELWRLTSAFTASRSDFPRPRPSAVGTKEIHRLAEPERKVGDEIIARLALLLKRLLQGEESHPEVFATVQSCLEYIASRPDLDDEQSAILESLVVARILYWLGYIGDASDLNAHIKSQEITDDLIETLKDQRAIFNKHINKALKESQL